MVGWHHWLNGHGFAQALRNGEGQGSLKCCSPLSFKKSDTTEQLNNSNNKISYKSYNYIHTHTHTHTHTHAHTHTASLMAQQIICLQWRRHRSFQLNPWVGKIPWKWKWYPVQYSCWKISWTEEPGRLQSRVLQRVRHDWSTDHMLISGKAKYCKKKWKTISGNKNI